MTAGATASTLTPLPAGKLATLVTFLQMAAPPPPRPIPARPDLALRLVERPDPDWYRDLYRRVGSDWLWFSRLLIRDRRARIHPPRPCGRGLVPGPGRPEPWASWSSTAARTARSSSPTSASCLSWSAAVPAACLMAHAIGRAFAQPIRRFWLHTCTLDHPAALGFYIRSGFTPYGRAIEIADDPRLTGALPRTAAPWLPVIG